MANCIVWLGALYTDEDHGLLSYGLFLIVKKIYVYYLALDPIVL
jgi:hypothetical protein